MSALMGSGALMLWLDVAAELDRETDGWYIDEHMPERIDIGGYLRARRFGALEGTPAYLTLFEAQTPAALASEGYLRLVNRISEQSKRIRAGFSNVARNTFKVRYSAGRGIGPIVASLRLTAVNPAQADVAAAALDAVAPNILRRHGVVGVHWLEAAPDVRARMDAVRAVGQSDAGVDYVLLIEATRVADVAAIRRDVVSASALSQLGWAEQSFAIYNLLYEVSAKGTETSLGDRL
ncbi:MAG TPA: hypothetical protein VGC38_04570 [Pseudolabrys sp.]